MDDSVAKHALRAVLYSMRLCIVFTLILFGSTLFSYTAKAQQVCTPLSSVNSDTPVTSAAIAVNGTASTLTFSADATPAQLSVDGGPSQTANASPFRVILGPTHVHHLLVKSRSCTQKYDLVQVDWPVPGKATAAVTPGGETFTYGDENTGTLTITLPAGGAVPSFSAILGKKTGKHLELDGIGAFDNAPVDLRAVLYDGNADLLNLRGLPANARLPIQIDPVSCAGVFPPYINTGPGRGVPFADGNLTIDRLEVRCGSPFGTTVDATLQITGVTGYGVITAELQKLLDNSNFLWRMTGTPNPVAITKDLSITPSAVDIAPGHWDLSGTLELAGVSAQSMAVPMRFSNAGIEVAAPNAPVRFSYKAFDFDLDSLQCSKVTGSFACFGKGNVQLPASANVQPAGSIAVSYNDGNIVASGGAQIRLGKYELDTGPVQVHLAQSQDSITASHASLSGPDIGQGISIENFGISSTSGQAPEYTGNFALTRPATFGNIATVSALQGHLSSLDGANLKFAAKLDFTDSGPDPLFHITIQSDSASAQFHFDKSRPDFAFPISSISGQILDRKIEPCDQREYTAVVAPDADTYSFCAEVHAMPANLASASDKVHAQFTFLRSGSGYILQDAVLSHDDNDQPLKLRFGNSYATVKKISLSYDANAANPDKPDPWFEGHVSTCKAYLQGDMTVNTGGLLAIGKPTDIDTTVNLGRDCMYGVATGLVYVEIGPNASAVIEKVALAHVRDSTDATKFDTIVAAQGHLQMSTAVIALDKIGYESIKGKVSVYHIINPWKTVEYTAMQNASSIVTAISAFIFAVFHH